jgi:glycine/D-amino acid oxidase-like deaminating enzyme
VIIGAGIQGILSLAEAVKQGFKRVIIVERKPW